MPTWIAERLLGKPAKAEQTLGAPRVVRNIS
jgi:hypothetical protein